MNELVDVIDSLALVMNEETARLQLPGRLADHRELTAAKMQLVGAMERRLAKLSRTGSNWMERLAAGDRSLLLDALEKLHGASDANARNLERHIDLSTELMAVVAAEAQRQTGKRSTSYCELGVLNAVDVPAPISVNASL